MGNVVDAGVDEKSEMDSIPPFNADGILPVGIWKATEADFKRRFVEDFPLSVTRRVNYRGFMALRTEVAPLSLQGWHWVDGSYVIKTDNPRDVDLTTFVDGGQVDGLSAEEQTDLLEYLYAQGRTEARYKCDTWLISVRQPEDALYEQYLHNRASRNELYGRTNFDKTGIDLPKGFLELVIMGKDDSAMSTVVIDDSELGYQQPEYSGIGWSAAFLEEHLGRHLRLLNELEATGDTRFSTRLEIMSMQREADVLRRRLELARLEEAQADAVLVVDGDPVVDHRVDVPFFARVVSILQELVEGLTVGSAASRLQVVSFAPSSFRTSFRISNGAEQDQGKSDHGARSGADALALILDGNASIEEIAQHLKSDRVRKAYVRLMRTIADAGASLAFTTREFPVGTKISTSEAQERSKVLDKPQNEKRRLTLQGNLITGSLSGGKFAIQDANGEIYTIRASKSVAGAVPHLTLGARVTATVEETTTRYADSNYAQHKFSLLSITEL